MKKYKPKDKKQEILKQLQDLGVVVTAQEGEILKIECDPDLLNEVKQITKLDFEEDLG